MGFGIQTRSSCLHGKHFPHWDISLFLYINLRSDTTSAVYCLSSTERSWYSVGGEGVTRDGHQDVEAGYRKNITSVWLSKALSVTLLSKCFEYLRCLAPQQGRSWAPIRKVSLHGLSGLCVSKAMAVTKEVTATVRDELLSWRSLWYGWEKQNIPQEIQKPLSHSKLYKLNSTIAEAKWRISWKTCEAKGRIEAWTQLDEKHK